MRKRSGLSQMELGARAGIDQSTASGRINQYERGKHTPDLLTVCNLARVLHVDAAYFYAEDDMLADLSAMYRQPTGDERKMLLDFARILASHTTEPSNTTCQGCGALIDPNSTK